MAYCQKCNSKIDLYAVVCDSCGHDFPDSIIERADEPFQFRLKSLLIAVILIAVAISFIYASFIEPSRVTAALEHRIGQLGGSISVSKRRTIISLKGQPVDDNKLSVLIPLLRKCPNLIFLDLSGALITDASIETLDSLPEKIQRNIKLENTAVTDAAKLRVGGLRITDPELIEALNRLSERSD